MDGSSFYHNSIDSRLNGWTGQSKMIPTFEHFWDVVKSCLSTIKRCSYFAAEVRIIRVLATELVHVPHMCSVSLLEVSGLSLDLLVQSLELLFELFAFLD